MENLGKWMGTIEASITNRIQEIKERISGVEDTVEEIPLAKENFKSNRFFWFLPCNSLGDGHLNQKQTLSSSSCFWSWYFTTAMEILSMRQHCFFLQDQTKKETCLSKSSTTIINRADILGQWDFSGWKSQSSNCLWPKLHSTKMLKGERYQESFCQGCCLFWVCVLSWSSKSTAGGWEYHIPPSEHNATTWPALSSQCLWWHQNTSCVPKSQSQDTHLGFVNILSAIQCAKFLSS